MKVTIFLFALYREKAGRNRLEVDLPEGATAGDAVRRVARDVPPLGPLLATAALAVNTEYAGPDTRLRDGDELALIPPVSGGAARRAHGATRAATVSITDQPINVQAAIAGLVRPTDGALVVFQGVVRDFTDGRRLLYMDYEAYRPMAEKTLRHIAEEVRAQFRVDDVAIVHRVGRLAVGEASLLVAVASPHRREAFAACQEVIDRVKRLTPVWKKEVWEGGEAWVAEAWVAEEHGHR